MKEYPWVFEKVTGVIWVKLWQEILRWKGLLDNGIAQSRLPGPEYPP